MPSSSSALHCCGAFSENSLCTALHIIPTNSTGSQLKSKNSHLSQLNILQRFKCIIPTLFCTQSVNVFCTQSIHLFCTQSVRLFCTQSVHVFCRESKMHNIPVFMLLPRSSNGALFSLSNISLKVAPEKLQQQKDSKSKHTYTVCSEKSRCILYAPSTCNEYLVLKLRKILIALDEYSWSVHCTRKVFWNSISGENDLV